MEEEKGDKNNIKNEEEKEDYEGQRGEQNKERKLLVLSPSCLNYNQTITPQKLTSV